VIARTVSPSGAVQLVVALFMSDQKDTRQAPSTELLTLGLMCDAVLPGSGRPTIVATGALASAPR
jgi:hypothetical protein